MRASTKLKQMIQSGKTYLIPGAYDGLSCRICQNAGAELIYATGGGIARSTGIPDMGLITPKEIADRLEQMVDAVDVPIIGDMDTGYGNSLNAIRALRAYEKVGLAGFHIEDQVFPKRCGHYEGKEVVPAEELVGKIRALKDAATDPDMVVIARTDALAVEGIDKAIERMHKYMAAGADVAFIEAPLAMAELELICRQVAYPKFVNMLAFGKTPILSVRELEDMGFKMVVAPIDSVLLTARVMREMAEVFARDGHTRALEDQMVRFDEIKRILGVERFLSLRDTLK